MQQSDPARGSGESFLDSVKKMMQEIAHHIFPDAPHWEYALTSFNNPSEMGDNIYSLLGIAMQNSTMISFKHFIIFTNVPPNNNVMHFINENRITLAIGAIDCNDVKYVGIAAGGTRQLVSNNPN